MLGGFGCRLAYGAQCGVMMVNAISVVVERKPFMDEFHDEGLL